MSSIAKGNKLEDCFYDYLLEQRDRKDLVFGIYPPELCKIYKKKKYFCKERNGDVEFDVVVEAFRQGAESPHIIVVFECKNYSKNISDNLITDFSDKVRRIFQHKGRAILVTTSPLQSGAQSMLESREIGLVKYNSSGFEILIERTVEEPFIRKGIFTDDVRSRALKFSSYHGGRFFSSIDDLFVSLEGGDQQVSIKNDIVTVPYVAPEEIKKIAENLLFEIGYNGGRVDLEKICTFLGLNLNYIEEKQYDNNGREILGFADFSKREISIHLHDNKHRERFTLGHEIGHFYLGHDKFLKSEHLIKEDLWNEDVSKGGVSYERLEAQANAFASYLLLPESYFLNKVAEYRNDFDIRDKGNGYIYVDNQQCNFTTYNSLLSALSLHFGASKQAIELKLTKLGLLNDDRK